MTARVLLNLLNDLGMRSNARLSEHCVAIFATSLIIQLYRSTNVRFYLSRNIKINLKNRIFLRENAKIVYPISNDIMELTSYSVKH